MRFIRVLSACSLATQVLFSSSTMAGEPTGIDENYLAQSAPAEIPIASNFSTKPHKSPALSVFLSFLLPGAGHAYLGDWATAGGILGLAAIGGSLVGFQYYRACSIYSKETGDSCFGSSSGLGDREKYAEYYRKDPFRWLGPLGFAIMSNDWFYGMYAAYRDARINNNDEGYRYRMPTESLADLAVAPFSINILKKPEVWAGLVGALGLGLGLSFLVFPQEEGVSHENPGFGFPLIAYPVGIGEEAIFRGYLQPAISEWATPWGGVTMSSLLFGAAHIGNAGALKQENRWRYYSFVLPFISGMGFYLGWLTKENTSLKESVALHVWYDFVLFAVSAIAGSSALGYPQFNFTIPLP